MLCTGGMHYRARAAAPSAERTLLLAYLLTCLLAYLLTCFPQVLREDIKQNRLKESLNLFDIACNRRYPDK